MKVLSRLIGCPRQMAGKCVFATEGNSDPDTAAMAMEQTGSLVSWRYAVFGVAGWKQGWDGWLDRSYWLLMDPMHFQSNLDLGGDLV